MTALVTLLLGKLKVVLSCARRGRNTLKVVGVLMCVWVL